MTGVTRLAQVTDDIVRMPVHKHACKKKQTARYKPCRSKPPGVIHPFGCQIKNPFTLHIAIQQIKKNSHRHDCQRHLALSGQQQREDESTLKIMNLKKHKEC